jgi:cobalt-zinc-cadmium efflux system protein
MSRTEAKGGQILSVKYADHNHDYNHGHGDVGHLGKGRLLLVIFFNLAISVAEIVGGLVAGSLSLVSDALHNLSDTVSIVFSYISLRISRRPRNKSKTYGYRRANILAAFVNSAALIAVAIYLLVEATRKFFSPTEVIGNIVIIVAIVGLLGNLFSVLVLRRSAKENINIKSSYLHLISDTLSSAAVIISGVIIRFTDAVWVDPVFSIIINLVILRSAYHVLKESVGILMQSAPMTVDIDGIVKKLKAIDGIIDAHHIHVWRLDEKNVILEAHVIVPDMLVSETTALNDAISDMLSEEFGIGHTVVQFDSDASCGYECKF